MRNIFFITSIILTSFIDYHYKFHMQICHAIDADALLDVEEQPTIEKK